MNVLVALLTGAGLGLACFGGLWLTLRRATRGPRHAAWLAITQLTRLAASALILYAVSRQGLGPALSGLTGFWIARWHLVRRLGATPHGR